jgi:tRNA_anti-like
MPRNDDDDDRPRRRRRRDDEDDDDRPRSRRRAQRDWRDADEDDYGDRPRRKKRRPTETSTVGAIGLAIGAIGLLVSFMPCFASISLIPAGIGLIVGFIGLYLAQRSDGRQGYGVPITAMAISFAAVLVAVGWLVVGKEFRKEMTKRLDREDREIQAEMAKEEARHKAEVAQASKDVQAASPDAVIRVTAAQFYQAYDNDSDRADRFYKNKVIEVTGVVHEVDFQGEVYTVHLKAGREEHETVDCNFAKNPEMRERLAQLRPGQTVTIRGKCLGDGSDLEACILVE